MTQPLTAEWLTPDLHVQSLPEAGMWRLTKMLRLQDYDGEMHDVPPGYDTDLASIPKFLRMFFSVNGKHRRAATLHDKKYKEKWATRKKCDQLFYRAMIAGGLGKWRAKTMYWGVRSGGWTRGRW